MNIVKKILLWIVAVFFVVFALASLPNVSAWIGLLTAALLLPIEKWQAVIRKFIKGKLKAILAVVLAVATFATFPAEDMAVSDGKASDAGASVISTTISVSDTASSVTSTTADTTKASTTTLATTKRTTSIAPTATTTTQKITITTTTTKKITTSTTTTTTTRLTTTTTKKITTTTKKTTSTVQKTKYVLNTESKKFHLPSCKRLPTKNRKDVTMSREEIVGMGYSPCGICKP